MTGLPLRLRIFLFFCLIACGSVASVGVAVVLGLRQAGAAADMSPFITVGIVSSLGSVALVAGIWLLFDENVAKPIEQMAAQFRVRTHSDVNSLIDPAIAKYLGDLAPAALALNTKLGEASRTVEETVEQQTGRLRAQRNQLIRILSDLPVAVIVARMDHQIVLYDGQAAELMGREAPVRLDGSVFDYLAKREIGDALLNMTMKGVKRKRIVLTGHSGASYTGHIRLFDDAAGYTLMLEPLSPDASRPVVFDFDLIEKTKATKIDDTRLSDLCFCAFDSETTGLNPVTDEVIQLGAIRVVNGKIVEDEIFDTLVNPGCPVPPASTAVHRITNAMVVDAAPFETVSCEFHKFARDAVLLAHNAAFDMSFLNRIGQRTGQRFNHPVLDTVHLSAMVFGGSAEHTLDALCDRLDIAIPHHHRHTALGDARATAQVFVALLPLLEARGFRTYGQVKQEMKKHSRILEVT